MESRTDTTFSVTRRINRRHEMNEMQLYDEESREEEALCGTESCDIDRITVQYYLGHHECQDGTT